MKYLSSVLILISAACATKMDDETRNVIYLCNGGYGIAQEANFQASIAKNIANGAAADFGLREEFYGFFLKHADVNGESAVNLYRAYIDCLTNKTSNDELVEILNSRKERIFYLLGTYGKKGDEEKFLRKYDKYIESIKSNNKLLSHELNREIQKFLFIKKEEIWSSHRENSDSKSDSPGFWDADGPGHNPEDYIMSANKNRRVQDTNFATLSSEAKEEENKKDAKNRQADEDIRKNERRRMNMEEISKLACAFSKNLEFDHTSDFQC